MAELGYPTSEECIWRRIDAMASPMHKTFVAEVDGVIAGFVGCSALRIYESDLPTGWIMALAVGKRFRRQGIGRLLVRAVEQWCCEHGIPDLRVHSGDQRSDAHKFYEQCGFGRAGVRFKKALNPKSSRPGAPGNAPPSRP